MSDGCNHFSFSGASGLFKMAAALPGPPGPAGATYTPSVSSDGTLSWTNNGGLPNPSPVNIKGPPGEPQTPSDAEPLMDGTASAGISTDYARGDHRHQSDYNKAPVIIDTVSGAVASFPDGADGLPLHKLTVQIEPVQAGSGDPSPENIRPISGWTGCKVTRNGKNFFADKTLVGAIKSFNIGTIAKNADGSFTVTLNSNATSTVLLSFNVSMPDYGSNATQNQREKTLPNGNYRNVFNSDVPSYFHIQVIATNVADASDLNVLTNSHNASFSIDDSFKYNWIRLSISAGCPAGTYILWPMILRADETDETYYPYAGKTVNVSWQTEAGTVYGGTLDATTGVLSVFPHYASYNGETLIGPWVSSMDVYAPGTSPTIGAQVVDMGGETITYQLTPQEVTTLLGANNIWADCGPVTVEYPADTKLYIDSKIAAAVAALS